ncbi:glycine/sarcosine/betaine reductase complex component C subunit alpha [Abyssisolibacter fermentans]|uniref:glycine/sarcosine/betaine reductase complex component C subunit alpha n=1 Tax=Abyssisolibacter fermentans TaxID=1766203 RepID=UPI00082E0567|nr:glycine/sarcosine/betaine reductase complex component C subunit alpha [Abyssisolibacter fermentans]
MEHNKIKQMIAEVFNDIADGIETGQFGKKVRIGVTVLGSEHGTENVLNGAMAAQENDNSIEVVLIGPKNDTNLKNYEADTEEQQHKVMEKLLDSGEIQGCVTLHYNFPIGVSTVGRVITPAKGKEMLIATTTGTSSPHRTEAMVKNGLYGIIVAKALGKKNPTVGILNVDGARQVERTLKELKSNGYDINFTESLRADGGAVMRGNDLLAGTPDVMITDSLTGNLLIKMFSSYTTGGSYEALGYGYGPGVGDGYERNILIISRASGSPLIASAIKYAGEVARGDIIKKSKEEFEKAKKAKLNDILKELTKDKKSNKEDEEEITPPKKEIVTGAISGIDIMDLEDAVKEIWKNNIYAETGMGCTGPIVMVNVKNIDDASDILAKAGYITKD